VTVAARLSEAEIDRLKREDDFLARVSRQVPDLKRQGAEFKGTCPEHGGRSFHVIPDKRFAHCFGCGKHWDPISWIVEFDGVTFTEAVRRLGGEVERGVDTEAAAAWRRAEAARARQIARDQEKKIDQARAIWREAQPIDGTPAERYLEGRGLVGPFPPSLRFHAALGARWTEGEEERTHSARLPALVAGVQEPGGRLQTVHRIYLEELVGGDVVKASIMPADQVKKLHGSPGAGAVRLAPLGRVLALAEGVETALAVRHALAAAGRTPTVWAAISAGQLVRLTFLPTWRPERVEIYADNDRSGTGARMARAACDRFRSFGVKAAWRMPAEVGVDWLDLVTKKNDPHGVT